MAQHGCLATNRAFARDQDPTLRVADPRAPEFEGSAGAEAPTCWMQISSSPPGEVTDPTLPEAIVVAEVFARHPELASSPDPS